MRVQGALEFFRIACEDRGDLPPPPAAKGAAEDRAPPALPDGVGRPPDADGADANTYETGHAATLAAWVAAKGPAAESPASEDLARFNDLVRQVHSDLQGLGALGDPADEPASAEKDTEQDEHVDILI